ncbi:MAG: serine/threonine protein kinase [Myxococcota bacterium]|jgi:serine/threonine protein kinase
MGLVLAAHDRVLDRAVALKVQIGGKRASETARKRFAQELKTLANLRIEGLARLLDGGVTEDGMAWYVMERVHGPTLDDVLVDAMMLPRDEALRMVCVLARTLAQIHAQGIAHRDIKPSNILLALDGSPVLVDFGLVTSLRRDDAIPRITLDVVGTPMYMAPEQSTQSWETIDWAKVDVYALGMVLIEALTGSLPPGALPALEMQSEAIRTLCSRATHRDPRHRFASPTDLADAIDSALNPRWWRSTHRSRVAAAVVGIVAMALVIPAAMVLSSSLAQQEREAVAQQRLEATWARIDGLSADNPDVDATFQAFIADPKNQHTAAWREAWRRRAQSSPNPEVVIESWASAWIFSEGSAEQDEALNGLVMSFLSAGHWEAMDALLVDTANDKFIRAGLDPDELRIVLDFQALRMDAALARMTPDDPRRALAEAYRSVQYFDTLEPHMHSGAIDGWICDPTQCLNIDGRVIDGPFSAPINGGPMGPLFFKNDYGIIRPNGTLVCALPFSRLTAGTIWNGALALATGGQERGVVLVDPESCETTPLPIADGGLNNWVTSVQAVDLNDNGSDELVVATGSSYGYAIRAISSDGQTVLDHKPIGDFRNLFPLAGGNGKTFVAALSNFHLSPYFFPDGGQSGIATITWTEDGFDDAKFLPHPVIDSLDAWMVTSGDLDNDGDIDIVGTHANTAGHLTVWLAHDGGHVPVMLGELSNGSLVQMDEDPELELVASQNGRAVVLGLGDETLVARHAPTSTVGDPRDVFSSTLRLRRLGLVRRSAEEAERIARTLASSEALDAWNTAGQAWMDANEPLEAARAYIEAATLGDSGAASRALDAYMSGWALDEAGRYSTRIGLPTRAPKDVIGLDFSAPLPGATWTNSASVLWNPNRQGLSVQGTSGMGTVLRLEVERRSDVFGIDVGMVVERLEWGANIEVRLVNPQTGEALSLGERAHGGDGELYRSPHVGGFVEYNRDDDPNGPHRERLFLAYDRQQDKLHAEAWSDDERILRHDHHMVFDTDTAIIEVALPFHPEVDAAVARVIITDLTLHGLVPTGRPVDPPTRTERSQKAERLWTVRTNPAAVLGDDDPLEVLAQTFEAGLHMHPTDNEFRQISLDQLAGFITAEAIDQQPHLALHIADSMVVGGQFDVAKSIYHRASLLVDPRTRVLAYAGLADIAESIGNDPQPYIRHGLNAAPNRQVGQAWMRRRRVGHLIPAE